MEVKVPAMMWILCYIFVHIITSNKNGFIDAKSLSRFKDLQTEKKLKSINKPAVKIIKTIDGERYGCVDFFKQPAFDYPSMKIHSYHCKMYLERMRGIKTNNNDNEFGYLWENGVGCPIGTVPIRRVTVDDILMSNSLDNNYKPRASWNTTTHDPDNVVHYDQHHYAVLRTNKIGMKYNGATMDLSLTAPKVKPTQYSASRLHIQLGDDYIQVGFTVNPALYKDNQPRTFVYTKAGENSCYNNHCNVGMISVRQDFPMGLALKPVSVRGQIQHTSSFGLIKDQANGNWYLEFGDNATVVGFWPSHWFRQSYGNLVEWGGEVYSASLPGPEMGYGYYPTLARILERNFNAHIKRISILDGNFRVDRQVTHIEEFSDSQGYKVLGFPVSKVPDIGHMLFYGGPGNF